MSGGVIFYACLTSINVLCLIVYIVYSVCESNKRQKEIFELIKEMNLKGE